MLQNLRGIKYWTIVTFPLVYFASSIHNTFLQQLDLLGALGIEDIPIYAYSYNFLLNIVRSRRADNVWYCIFSTFYKHYACSTKIYNYDGLA